MNTEKADHVKQLIDQGLQSLVENLEKGRSALLLVYLAAMARIHRYSFLNIELIQSQFPSATSGQWIPGVKEARTFCQDGRAWNHHLCHGLP